MIRPISLAYVQIVKRVAQGLSREDGEELARGLYCIRPYERFTTHVLGSAWLCYAVMLAWFWAPIVIDVVLEQSPAPFHVWDYERTLAEGATANALNVWKVCARNAGIVRALAQRLTPAAPLDDPPPLPVDGNLWQALAASLAFASLCYATWLQHPHAGFSLAAFVPFYMQSGGNSMNAGSTTANAADVTSTNGSWDITADTFIATAATPFASVTANVDYASIYVDGTTTGAVYVALITAVNSGGLSITLSSTIKYGTKPSASATGRSCKVNGAWADETALVQLGSGAVPQSTKVNIKQATYTVTANRTISMAGATTKPLWFSGYNTTPGDLDADITNSLTKPTFAFNATFGFTWSGAHQLWSSISSTGAITGDVVILNGSNTFQEMIRCRGQNTSANTSARAMNASGTGGLVMAYSWFTTPTTATAVGVVNCNASQTWVGVVAEGGGLSGFEKGNTALLFSGCIGYANTGSAFRSSATGAVAQIIGCTAYAPTVDAFKFSGALTATQVVVGCLAAGLNGGAATTNGLNNSTGTSTNFIARACNDYYNVTNPEVGMGDSFAFFPQTDSAFPLTSSTDMTPLTTANAYKNGFPQVFEGGGALGSQVNGGKSIGAVDPTPSAGGGVGSVFIFGG